MTVQIRIDQPSGAGTGSAGSGRDDLWAARNISLYDAGSGEGPRQWSIVVPPGSTAALSNATSNPATISGVQLGDSYRVTLVKNSGLFSGDTQTRVCRVTKSTTGVTDDWALPLPIRGEQSTDSTGISSPSGWHVLWYTIVAFLRAFLVGSLFTTVLPSGDTSGATDTAKIQGILDRGLVVYVVQGATYYLNAKLTFSSNSGISAIGVLPARFVVNFTGSPDAFTRTNCVFSIAGTTTGTVNTTFSTAVDQGDTSCIASASIPTSMADGWLRARGIHGVSQPARNNIVSELFQVAANHTTSTTFNLQWAAFLSHATVSHALVSIAPVLDVIIDNVYIDVPLANTSIAVGILVQDSARIQLKRISGRNMSLSLIDTYGARGVFADHITSRGTTNSTLLIETTQASFFQNIYRTAEGTRTHSLGWPQAEINLRACSVTVGVVNGNMTHASAGARFWGCVNCSVANMIFSDLNATEAVDRDSAVAAMGILIDGGPVPTGAGERTAEFGYGNSATNIQGTNLVPKRAFNASLGNQPAIYFHDQYHFTVNDVHAENNNPSVSYPGIIIIDSSGTLTNITLSGLDCGIFTANAESNVILDQIYLIALPSANANLFFFDHSALSPKIRTLYATQFNGNGWCTFGPSYVNNEDLTIDQLIFEKDTYRDVVVMTAQYGASPGMFGTIQAAGSQPPEVVVATGTSAKNVIYASHPTFSPAYALIAFGNSTIYMAVGQTPKKGDIIISNASGRGIVDVSAPAYPIVWFMGVGHFYSDTLHILGARKP